MGRLQPKARVSAVRRNLKEAGGNWSDGQKSDMRPKGEDKIAKGIEVR